jgi:hypothetical protein
MSLQAFVTAQKHHMDRVQESELPAGPERLTERVAQSHVNEALRPACSPLKQFTLRFANEFRLMLVTLVTVVAALSFQTTLQEFFQKARMGSRKVLWLFLISVSFFLMSTLIVLCWKPFTIPSE